MEESKIENRGIKKENEERKIEKIEGKSEKWTGRKSEKWTGRKMEKRMEERWRKGWKNDKVVPKSGTNEKKYWRIFAHIKKK